MTKVHFAVGGGLAIAAAVWMGQASTLLPQPFFSLSSQSHASSNAAVLVQSNTRPDDLPMTTERLGEVLSETVETLNGSPGQWQFEYNGVAMVVVTNNDHDRMRIVAPITSLANLTSEQREKMLFANFHTTLDARYAIGTFGGQPAVVSVFAHPLSSISKEHFQSALDQVNQTAQTFGTTYSSGELLLSPNGTPNRPSDDSEDVAI